ncbi:enoyl-CoA hydratase [Afipia sp. P52-10]|uniref:enoyl-CoA hydratase/isomerase family protein n=1 Tax=Afipia sp. P52-10 TaxID=1429916 RepID=UPI0003DF0496|nr:enoyl-CoA hydratase-related protein [Afipia sp. P52-10]ETR78744.1 enoyl-CoA hydratase [Afipia sp. P52-10]
MNDTANNVIGTLENGVAVLTLNAPARKNALSTEIRFGLRAAFEKYLANPACRAIVLTGAAQTFCAGGDISQMKPPPGITPREYSLTRMKALHDSVRFIAAGPKPVVAAVEGHAAGAGMSLAAACDYVIAADDARFVASFGKIGLAADCGLLWSLPHRVGHAKARDLLLTARTVSAEEAHHIGLADEVVAKGATLARAIEKAQSYATTAPLAIALTKRVMAGELDDLNLALENEIEWQAELRATSDHQEARDAFLQKRKPNFQGR